MKTIIIISLFILSLKTFGQTNSNDYKDYSPCINCESISNNSSSKQSGNNIKESTKREVVGKSKAYSNRVKSNFIRATQTVVITTLTVATSAVISKLK